MHRGHLPFEQDGKRFIVFCFGGGCLFNFYRFVGADINELYKNLE
jgi:hypothetical protein